MLFSGVVDKLTVRSYWFVGFFIFLSSNDMPEIGCFSLISRNRMLWLYCYDWGKGVHFISLFLQILGWGTGRYTANGSGSNVSRCGREEGGRDCVHYTILKCHKIYPLWALVHPPATVALIPFSYGLMTCHWKNVPLTCCNPLKCFLKWFWWLECI